jgi:hypothetical protein
MPDLETEGKFRCKPIGRWIQTAKTGTIGAGVQFYATHYYSQEKRDWLDCQDRHATLDHVFWIYKADNSPIQFAIDALKGSLGWSGDILDFDPESPWAMPLCEIETKNETYNGKTRLRVKWLNPLGGKRGGGGKTTSRGDLEAVKRRLAGEAEPPPPPPQADDGVPF